MGARSGFIYESEEEIEAKRFVSCSHMILLMEECIKRFATIINQPQRLVVYLVSIV